MNKEDEKKDEKVEEEERILFYDPGLNVSYDIKLSAAIKYIERAKELERELKDKGKI